MNLVVVAKGVYTHCEKCADKIMEFQEMLEHLSDGLVIQFQTNIDIDQCLINSLHLFMVPYELQLL